MSENVESGMADDVTETPAAAGAEGQEGIADEEKNDGFRRKPRRENRKKSRKRRRESRNPTN